MTFFDQTTLPPSANLTFRVNVLDALGASTLATRTSIVVTRYNRHTWSPVHVSTASNGRHFRKISSRIRYSDLYCWYRLANASKALSVLSTLELQVRWLKRSIVCRHVFQACTLHF